MNKILAAIGVLTVGGGLSLCDVCGATHSAVAAKSAPQVASVPHAAEIRIVTFKVKGMTCGGCVFGVRRVLTRLAGVSKVDVSYEQSRAVVTYDPAAVTVEQMVAAIKTLGYTATAVTPAAT